jgi:iron(III) transport system ATP-binding protein
MATVRLIGIRKEFGDVLAVDQFSVDIADGEFVSFLGPSGCGKTTTLRMIAGFDMPTSGDIYIGDILMSSVERSRFASPEERNIGMVFQNYAVWPHMTVFDNIAYPLKIKKEKRGIIKDKVEQHLSLVGLEGFGERYPHQLSGGQQQRVALARALIMDPEVMLLDEPLSNLDAKLREEMRFEIKDLQKKTGVTIVYVTHDQAEAIVMSDRIVVMNTGYIQQVDSPKEIYENPANKFVADFIGLTNFVECEVISRDTVLLGDGTGSHKVKAHIPSGIGKKAILSVRPENIEIGEKDGDIKGVVTRTVYLGNMIDYRITVGDVELRVERDAEEVFPEGSKVTLRFKKTFIFSV